MQKRSRKDYALQTLPGRCLRHFRGHLPVTSGGLIVLRGGIHPLRQTLADAQSIPRCFAGQAQARTTSKYDVLVASIADSDESRTTSSSTPSSLALGGLASRPCCLVHISDPEACSPITTPSVMYAYSMLALSRWPSLRSGFRHHVDHELIESPSATTLSALSSLGPLACSANGLTDDGDYS